MKITQVLHSLATYLILLGIAFDCQANPFARSISQKKKPSRKQEKTLDVVHYKGYAFVGKFKYALVEINGNSHMAGTGQKIGNVRLTEITSRYLKYKIGNRSFLKKIRKDDK